MAFATNPQTTTLTAFLSGVPAEPFSLTTTFNNANTAYLGFTGITFDQIQILVSQCWFGGCFGEHQDGRRHHECGRRGQSLRLSD